MTIAASVIIDRCEKTLLDDTNVLWSAAELLDYLNAAISALVTIKPDTYVLTASFTLTNATPKQTLPAGGLQLFEVTRNISPVTTSITQSERNHLNHINNAWPATAGTPAHFMHDERNPKLFYIYPQPASGTNTVEIVYSALPTRLTAVGDTVPVDDIYENPLYYYVLALAYAKNAKRGDNIKMNNYLTLFSSSLGLRNQVQFPRSPKTPMENPQGAGEKRGPTE